MNSPNNPYGSPADVSSINREANDDDGVTPRADSTNLIPLAQLGLRLLGVMFIVDGVSGLAGSLTNGLMQAAVFRQAGYDSSLDPYAYGWAMQSIALVAIGVYCVFGGTTLLRLVFQPTRSHPERSPSDSAP